MPNMRRKGTFEIKHQDTCNKSKHRDSKKSFQQQSSGSSEQGTHAANDGWDSNVFNPLPMDENDESRDFLKKIQAIAVKTECKTIEYILNIIPVNAIHVDISYKRLSQGFEFKWNDPQGNYWRLYTHGPDDSPNIPETSNAAQGWIVRVIRNNQFMDTKGNFLSGEEAQYDDTLINDTHIPLTQPTAYTPPHTRLEDFPWGRAYLELQDRLAKPQ